MAVSKAKAQQHQLQLFTAGSEVEVQSYEEGFQGVWFRATIVTSPTKKKRALVEYKNLVTDDGSRQLDYVNFAYLRPPPPPPLSDRKLEVGDVVDADCKDKWWTGAVKEVLDNNSKFKVLFASPPDLIEFERDRLRLHQDWVDGRWVRPDNSNQNTKLEKKEVDSKWSHPITNRRRRTKPNRFIQDAGYICALPSQRRKKETGKEENTNVNSDGRIVQNGATNKEVELPLPTVSKMKGKEGSLLQKSCHLPNEGLQVRDQKKNGNDLAHEKNKVMSAERGSDSILAKLLHTLVLFPNMESKKQPAAGSSNKRKRGRPRKVVVTSPQTSEGASKNGPGNVADPHVIKDQKLEEAAVHVLKEIDSTDPQDASRRKIGELSGTSCVTSEAARIWVGESDNTDDDDRPLFMWFTGMQCPASVGESRTSPDKNVDQHSDRREAVEIARESSAADPVNGSGPDKKQGLPFAKTSPVWKTINALEVFRMLPQNPHFRPLGTCKEEYREGLAIGNMITFSSVVEKIIKLHFDDPRNVFESILETILDLEKYGFSVSVLRGRVNSLLAIKDRQGRFEVESKDSECKIVEHSHDRTKLAEEEDRLAKKIIELLEKQALMKAEMEAKELEISRLQLHVSAIKEGMETSRSDFQKLSSAPLK